MKVLKVVSSDVYQTVRTESVQTLKNWIDARGANSLYPFQSMVSGGVQAYTERSLKSGAVLEGYNLHFTYEEVLRLLEKAILIAESTQEGFTYKLKKIFLDDKDKKAGVPPGTLRFYSQHLICFWTGKNWRKITL